MISLKEQRFPTDWTPPPPGHVTLFFLAYTVLDTWRRNPSSPSWARPRPRKGPVEGFGEDGRPLGGEEWLDGIRHGQRISMGHGKKTI